MMIKLFVFIIFAGASLGQDANQTNTQYITEKNTSLKFGTELDLNYAEITSEPTLKVNDDFSEISSYLKEESGSSSQNRSCPDFYENLLELDRKQDIINQNLSILEGMQRDLDEKRLQFETEEKKLDEDLIQLEDDKKNIAEANRSVAIIKADIEYYRAVLIQQINYYNQSSYELEQLRIDEETYRLQLEETNFELIERAKELNNKEKELRDLDLDCSRSKLEEINSKLGALEKERIEFDEERTQFEEEKMKLAADLLQLKIDQKLVYEANDDLENIKMELEYNRTVLEAIINNYTQSYYELQQQIKDQENKRLRMEKDYNDCNKKIRESQPCNRNCSRSASGINQAKLNKERTEMNQYRLVLEKERKNLNEEHLQFGEQRNKFPANLVQLEVDPKKTVEANSDTENRALELEDYNSIFYGLNINLNPLNHETKQEITNQEHGITLEEIGHGSNEITKLDDKDKLGAFSRNSSRQNNDGSRLRLGEENTEINQVSSMLGYKPREPDDERLLLENEEGEAADGLESLEIDEKYLPEADFDMNIE